MNKIYLDLSSLSIIDTDIQNIEEIISDELFVDKLQIIISFDTFDTLIEEEPSLDSIIVIEALNKTNIEIINRTIPSNSKEISIYKLDGLSLLHSTLKNILETE